MTTENTLSLKLLLIHSDGGWIAASLDPHIMAQGDSVKSAIRQFKLTLAAELLYGMKNGNPDAPLADIGPAPDRFWRDFEDVGAVALDSSALDIQSEFRDISHVPLFVQEARIAA